MKKELIEIDWTFEPYKSTKELIEKSDKKYAATWAALCAEGVLECFNSSFPNDNAPTLAIQAALAWTRGELTISEAKKAASAAYESAKMAEAQNNVNATLAAKCAGLAASSTHLKNYAFSCLQYALSIKK